MIKHKYLIISLLAIVQLRLSAQEYVRPRIISEITSGKHVEIAQSAAVERLLSMQIANNMLERGIMGYRIRIFSKSGQTARQQAANRRAAFVSAFPDISVYLQYHAPNFQLFVGDFRTKSEALYYNKQIAKKFPNAFIISGIINILK